ncbi:MAG: hypothetical protein KatS3mg038_1050 [Candidatus Kapaibacterium sp.]|nr:MAG: hypothetical protein KatS3mg038_1050 [Candidatus Kapabacteria bacterium]
MFGHGEELLAIIFTVLLSLGNWLMRRGTYTHGALSNGNGEHSNGFKNRTILLVLQALQGAQAHMASLSELAARIHEEAVRAESEKDELRREAESYRLRSEELERRLREIERAQLKARDKELKAEAGEDGATGASETAEG